MRTPTALQTRDAPGGEAVAGGATPGGRPPLSMKGRALRLLAQREHSRAELERKLRVHEQHEGELSDALDALQAKGFINEERVADSVVHRRASKLGVNRVKAELQAKGLDDALVRDTVDALRATEQERATEVWRKKFGQAPQDAAERAKQMRFLAARGFAAEVVRRVVNAAAHDETDQGARSAADW